MRLNGWIQWSSQAAKDDSSLQSSIDNWLLAEVLSLDALSSLEAGGEAPTLTEHEQYEGPRKQS